MFRLSFHVLFPFGFRGNHFVWHLKDSENGPPPGWGGHEKPKWSRHGPGTIKTNTPYAESAPDFYANPIDDGNAP